MSARSPRHLRFSRPDPAASAAAIAARNASAASSPPSSNITAVARDASTTADAAPRRRTRRGAARRAMRARGLRPAPPARSLPRRLDRRQHDSGRQSQPGTLLGLLHETCQLVDVARRDGFSTTHGRSGAEHGRVRTGQISCIESTIARYGLLSLARSEPIASAPVRSEVA